MRWLLPAFVALALCAAGCGSGSTAQPPTAPTTPRQTNAATPEPRSAYAKSLTELCSRTRASFEALGPPSEKPPAVLLPGTIRVAGRFLRALRALRPSPTDAARVKKLTARYALWYQGDRFALLAIRQHNQEAFINVQEGADHWLAAAESIANSLGAPECTRRPFESP
jgi:hypothetical protein